MGRELKKLWLVIRIANLDLHESVLQQIVSASSLQDCGSGSGLDPDSIGSVDSDSDSESGSRRAKMTHKSRIFFFSFMF